MGRLAVAWILEIIRDARRFARAPLQQLLAPTLIVRRTCGALADSAQTVRLKLSPRRKGT
ncbi:MAG: hypothetical protein ACHQ7N_07865 [Candidatus Methylomirabilales bacterium]